MDVLSVVSIWVPIAVAMVLLLKSQANHLSAIRNELDASRRALRESGSEVLALAARLDDIEGLKVGVLTQLSHELRTPIFAIREAAAVITRYGERKPETARTFGEKIGREADRLVGMIENLLSAIKTSATKESNVGLCMADPKTRHTCKAGRPACDARANI